MKSSKKLQISSHLSFVYINNQDRKWRMSVLVFSSALTRTRHAQWYTINSSRDAINELFEENQTARKLKSHTIVATMLTRDDRNKIIRRVTLT